MIVSFADKELEDLYKLPFSKLRKIRVPREIIEGYRKRIEILAKSSSLRDVSKLRGLNLEKLKGDYKTCYSIRVNIQYRIIFKEICDGAIEILIVELSKHYE